MKRIIRTMVITVALLTGLTIGGYFLLTKDKGIDSLKQQEIKQEESGESAQRAYIFSTDSDSSELITEGEAKNVLVFDYTDPFDPKQSQQAKERLDRLSSRTKPDFDNPLIAYNPFGTNANTFYFYFETNRKVSVKYTITVADESIPDFVRTVYSGDEKNIGQKHEFTVGGIIPGMKNYIILTLCDENGEKLESTNYSYNAPNSSYESITKGETVRGKVSSESTSNGLFLAFPKKKDVILSYDNSGYLRGETLLNQAAGKRMVCSNNHIFYMVSDTKLVNVSPIGQVLGSYSIQKWGKASDFDYDGYGNLFVVARKKHQSMVLRINLETGKIKRILKLDSKVKATSIAVPGDGRAYVASGSPSGILIVSGIASESSTKVDGVLGKKNAWKNTKYSKKVFKKTGKLADAKHFSTLMFNSDKSSLSFYDSKKGGSSSRYVEYDLSLEKKTYEVFRTLKVPYSPSGSGQWYNTHYVICSGNLGKFIEFDTAGEQIKEFSLGIPLFSAMKQDFKQTCFY